MAKLRARGRKEWLRFERGGVRVAFMSDGKVLRQHRIGDRWECWKLRAKWRLATPLKQVREMMLKKGWHELSARG